MQQPLKQVFVVDDDWGIRELMTELLEDAGYAVVTAADGREALAYLRSCDVAPCLILLDLNMPVMTGWEFRHEQQGDPALDHIPVAVISADRSIDTQSVTIDALAFLAKPIDFQRLLDLVAACCPTDGRAG